MTFGPAAMAAVPTDSTPADASPDAHASLDEHVDGFSGDIPLSEARTKFTGETDGDALGKSVASLGDLSGDGSDDVALGIPDHDEETGAVALFFGPVDAGEIEASAADLTLTGENAGDWAGYAVDAADLTGDGMNDLVVGAPHAEDGTVYVFYGADLHEHSEGDGPAELSLADASVMLSGDSPDSQFGHAVAADVTDEDADAAVLAVGAPGTDDDTGAAHVFERLDGATSAADADATFAGDAAGDHAGFSVAVVPEHTDDGHGVVAVGAPHAGEDAGAVYALTDFEADGSLADAHLTLEGEGAGTAGWAVANAGDVTGDDRNDLVVGAPHDDGHGTDAGAAYVLFAESAHEGVVSLGDADATMHGVTDGERAGYSLAGSNDLLDGEHAGILVGAPGSVDADDAGAAYLVDGASVSGEVSLSDAQATFTGEAAGDEAGYSVATSGDVSGTGEVDVLVGAPGHGDAGAAYIVGDDPKVEKVDEPRDEKVDEVEVREVIKEEKIDEEKIEKEEHIDVEEIVDVEKVKEEPKERIDVEEVVKKERVKEIVVDEEEVDEDVKEVVEVEKVKEKVKERIVVEEGPFFDVDFVHKNDPVTAGDELKATVLVTNTGDEADTQDIRLEIGGEQVDVATGVELGPGEREKVVLTWATTEDDIGGHTVTAHSDDDTVSQDIEVVERPVDEAFFDVEIVEKNDPINATETLYVTAEITNTGDATDTQDIRLQIGGIEVDRVADVTLEPGESTTVELTWQSDEHDVGKHLVKVLSDDDYDWQKIDVLEPVPDPDEVSDFRFVDVDKPTEINTTETFEATVTIENVGDAEGTETISLQINGETVDSAEITLGPGETGTVTLTWAGTDEPGTYTVGILIGDQEVHTQDLVVVEEPEPVTEFEFVDVDKPTEINTTETFNATVSVQNVGDTEGTANVSLTINGEVVDTQQITLGAGETGDVTLTWAGTDEPGTYQVGILIDGEEVHTQDLVVVEEPEPVSEFEFVEVDKPTEINTTETFTANVSVQNVGDTEGTANVSLTINGQVVDTQPITLGPGETGTVTLTWAGTEEPGTYTVGILIDGEEVHTQDLVVVEEPEPVTEFEFVDIDKPTEINTTETFTANVSVQNVGDTEGTANVSLTINGQVVDTQPITLGAGEEGTVTLTWAGTDEPGTYQVGILIDGEEVHTQELTVVEEPEPVSEFEFVDIDKPTQINATDEFTAVVTVENTGTAEGTANVSLTIDGQVVDTQQITLGPGETGDVTLTWEGTDEPGDYTVGIQIDGEEVHTQLLVVVDIPPIPGQFAISFIAFCYPDGADATVSITFVDDPNDPRIVEFEIDGDAPTAIVHKTGGGDDQIFQQPGTTSGTVVAGVGTFVGDERTPANPCPDGTTDLKFEDGDLSVTTTLTVGDGGAAAIAGQAADEDENGDEEAPEDGEGDEEAPEDGEGDEEAPEDGEGDEEAPEDGEGDEEAPEDGEGDEEAPEDGEGDEESPEDGEGDEESPEDGEGDAGEEGEGNEEEPEDQAGEGDAGDEGNDDQTNAIVPPL
ncbi:CARDB domain-containing protein [Halovivax gelatinilyticus]|uniref:CARDB domain-containing protein n=1 Tax=Halovivax gelatinilyticus TaxID=2961597 RepID=UPI0020CA8B2C|nr:CARDB domain-containing protein [Halovivax gelatinilyticus]